MSKVALVQILERLSGAHEEDLDSSLLIRFLSHRDQDAFAALVRRHGPLVYGTCRRILGNRADTDDAFQAVFFVLARRASTLKPDRSIGPWLYVVAVRVAKKLRSQIVKRRLREMSAAKSEQLEAAEPEHDFWQIIHEELARMSQPMREVLVLCDLSGQSHAQAAASVGFAKGTITKRLGKAREELAARLERRGITLGVGALSTRMATQAPVSIPAPLILETVKHAVAFAIGQAAGSVMARTLAESVMRSLKFGVFKAWLVVGLLGLMLTGGGLMLAGGPASPDDNNAEPPQARTEPKPDAAKVGTMWKENYAVEYAGSLPVSVAFSADGKTLLTGDTNGEMMALIFVGDDAQYRWKSKADGSPAVVAYSADQKHVYATTAHGVRVLNAATGQDVARIDAADSSPTSIAVFPDKTVAEKLSRSQIVFGNACGYFVKSWLDDKFTGASTIQTSTVVNDTKPKDAAAAPLAIDPQGRCAIMAGPVDPKTNKNILWAYVCGDYDQGSPGNRVLQGHAATVVAAAWSKASTTAVTGDADGRVIVWDTKSMKEIRRVELGSRVLAIAISDDGANIAAYIRGKQGAEIRAWETAKPTNALKSIHTQQADFGAEPRASLAFSPDGRRLAGCAIDTKWLQVLPRTLVSGKVRVWELSPELKAQRPPRLLYATPLPKGSSASFVIPDNHSILMPAKEGAIDCRDLKDGSILFRLVLGRFAVGRMVLSWDRKWLAMEQRSGTNKAGNEPFSVGVYDVTLVPKATIPSCSQMLDIASGGSALAVVREKQIELWDVATAKELKAAPFKYARIDAAQFSPDGKLLAISDCNELILWRWQENTHQRIGFGHRVGSMTFTPDGRFLAEGPMPGDNIQIRNVETGEVVQTLSSNTRRPMNVPRLAYTQSGRALIACDTIMSRPGITLWDTATGGVAHQIALADGLPSTIDTTPNGKYLAAMLDDGNAGSKLGVWRLDGEGPPVEQGATAPASASPP